MGMRSFGAALLMGCAISVAAPATASYADNTIIFLAGPSSDPFWGAVEQGFNTATKELGLKTQWVAPQDFNDIVPIYTKMFEAAIARRPGAIVVGDFFPEPTDPLIKQAVAAGIPILIYNSGGNGWKD